MSNSAGTISIPVMGAHIVSPEITAEEILANPTVGGSITLPKRTSQDNAASKVDIVSIPFYLTNNFSFSLGNSWGKLVDMGFGETLQTVANLLGAINGSTQFVAQSKKMMSATWTGSTIPEFQINTVFVATQRTYNPLEIIKILGASCLPLQLKDSSAFETLKNVTEGAAKGVETGADRFSQMVDNPNISRAGKDVANLIRDLGLAAPLDYGLDLTGDGGTMAPRPNTTITLQIGNWFLASNLVMSNISNISFSKEVIAPPAMNNGNYHNDLYKGHYTSASGNTDYGFPLYVECTLTLRPITYITPQEFNSYFDGLKTRLNTIADVRGNTDYFAENGG